MVLSLSNQWMLQGHYHCGPVEMNPTGIHEDVGLIPGLAQWVGGPALLWLWCRLAAVVQIRPLAWELPHAMGVALKSKKKKKLEVNPDFKEFCNKF